MTPYHSDPWLTVWQGDCPEVMAQMEPESVHCVVTSPPYWGLRDYGTATWLGGDEEHVHEGSVMRTAPPGTEKQASNKGASSVRSGPCRCGAVRQDSQLGLEPTPEEYVANMVAVFREVRRVLRKDGTCWVNLGDSYNSSPSNQLADRDWGDGHKRDHYVSGRMKRDIPGLKPKDLVGIPWRVAFALQADGWYLRSDIIWSKPNPMPESVTDRPTKAHEYVFLLSKSARYYYDADAVREPSQDVLGPERLEKGRAGISREDYQPRTQGWNGSGMKSTYRNVSETGRNLRSVWSIATQPYPGAHFATFPEALVEPCVKAGTSERGVCPECGAPWRRVTSTDYDAKGRTTNGPRSLDNRDITAGFTQRLEKRVETMGWQPSCSHEIPPVPPTVLDPFAGSGTTGRVAQRLGRRAVLIDLNGEYLVQAMKRNADIPLGLETA